MARLEDVAARPWVEGPPSGLTPTGRTRPGTPGVSFVSVRAGFNGAVVCGAACGAACSAACGAGVCVIVGTAKMPAFPCRCVEPLEDEGEVEISGPLFKGAQFWFRYSIIVGVATSALDNRKGQLVTLFFVGVSRSAMVTRDTPENFSAADSDGKA